MALLTAALLYLSLAVSTHAAPNRISTAPEFSKTGYDQLVFLGWNDACSVAVEYLVYPPVGDGLQGIPRRWRIGTLTIAPEYAKSTKKWNYASGDDAVWEDTVAGETISRLTQAGYSQKGNTETISAAASSNSRLEAILRSPAALSPGQQAPAGYALREIHYSPLGTCALLVFRNPAAVRDSYRYTLVRLPDPSVRRARARAHTEKALLLYENADIYSASAELAIASAMDPDYAQARYHYAALLAAQGRAEESLSELKAAIRLDPKYKGEARKAMEFEDLRRDPRFKAVLP